MEALIDRNVEDMAELCTDEDEALEIFIPYCGDMEAVKAILSNATFEAGKPECKTKDKKGEIEYTLTLPDYESCLDEDLTFEVVKDGVVVFQADVNYIGIYDQADCYVEPEDLGVSEFEAGDYTFNVYDSHRGLIVSATCTVA